MPMIDVYAPENLLPTEVDRQLGERLALAVLRAEGVTMPTSLHLNHTAVFIHRMPSSAIHTAATGSARAIRVQVLTPPSAIDRAGQKRLVAEATGIVADLVGDPSQAPLTWVLLAEAAEAAEGGWGMLGTAYGREEFTGLRESIATSRPIDVPRG
jgi:hypothetical protein